MTRALITGAAGQDGIYLARLLLDLGYHVTGTVRPGWSDADPRTAYLDGVELVSLDLRDRDGLRSLLGELEVDELYNLGGFTSVGASWGNAIEVTESNGLAVVGILDTLVELEKTRGKAPRYYQPSSSEMFGISDHQPQSELTPHHPRSPYAATKSFAHHLTVNYRESYGLFACTGTLYNHESPLRGPQFVTRKISQAVAEIALGRRDELTLGNLDVRRDWGHARDYVRSMHAMLQLDEPQDFIIGTGHSHSLAELLQLSFAAVGIDDPSRYVRQDPAFMRPADVPELVGEPTKAREQLGWSTTLDLAATVEHMVSVDLRRLESGVAESMDYLQPASTDG